MTIDYIRSYKRAYRDYVRRVYDLEEYRWAAMHPTAGNDGLPSAHSNAGLEVYIIGYEHYYTRVLHQAYVLKEMRGVIREAIETLAGKDKAIIWELHVQLKPLKFVTSKYKVTADYIAKLERSI